MALPWVTNCKKLVKANNIANEEPKKEKLIDFFKSECSLLGVSKGGRKIAI